MPVTGATNNHGTGPVHGIANPQTIIQEGKNMRFQKGQSSSCVGTPQPIAGFPIPGAERMYIKGDGSCWARSLWQVVFHQILNDQTEFDRFIQTAAKSVDEMHVQAKWVKGTIHILYQLKNKSPQDRIDYLNHANVDDTLIFFMREVAGEFMSKNFTMFTPQQIHEIKTNKNKYGGPEINAFARHFGIETHNIFKRHAETTWLYAYKGKDDRSSKPAVNVSEIKIDASNQVMMFAANRDHFEVIRFANIASAQNIKPDAQFISSLQTSLNNLSEEISAAHVGDEPVAQIPTNLLKIYDNSMQEAYDKAKIANTLILGPVVTTEI